MVGECEQAELKTRKEWGQRVGVCPLGLRWAPPALWRVRVLGRVRGGGAQGALTRPHRCAGCHGDGAAPAPSFPETREARGVRQSPADRSAAARALHPGPQGVSAPCPPASGPGEAGTRVGHPDRPLVPLCPSPPPRRCPPPLKSVPEQTVWRVSDTGVGGQGGIGYEPQSRGRGWGAGKEKRH